MTAETKYVAAKAVALLLLMAVSYAAATASASCPMTVTRLDSAVGMPTKARALLDAAGPSARAGAADVSTARQALDKALDQTQRAAKAEAGRASFRPSIPATSRADRKPQS